MMDTNGLYIFAGIVSTIIFVFSNTLMVYKAYRTSDLNSYSLGHLAFTNLGNLIHWAYISSLPFGPIWFLHAYYSLVAALMLFWYFRFRRSGGRDTQEVQQQVNNSKTNLQPVLPSNYFVKNKSANYSVRSKSINPNPSFICLCGCLEAMWTKSKDNDKGLIEGYSKSLQYP